MLNGCITTSVRICRRRKAPEGLAHGTEVCGESKIALVERGSFSASVMDSVIEAVLLIRTL